MSDIRKQGGILAYQVARDIENLLNFMNANEDEFVVSTDEDAVIFEEDMHLHIGNYMKLGKSLEGPKPISEEK